MTFADNYNLRNKSVVKMNDVASAVDALLVTTSQVVTGGAISTTSTSFVDMTSMSISVTVASGESVILLSFVSMSHGTSNEAVEMQFTRGGVAIGNTHKAFTITTGTGGEQNNVPLMYIDTGTTGSLTYKVQWKVGIGTGYVNFRKFAAIVVQTS